MTEWWDGFTVLQKFFLGLAIPFSILTVLELILELVGFGGHSHDMDDGGSGFDAADGDGLFGHLNLFTVRNMIYFLMMFGWVGLACSKGGWMLWLTIPAALLAGLVTTLVIAWIFYGLSRLAETGNFQISNAVGKIGTVYLSIPEKRSSTGQVQVVVQGTLQELDAMTDGEKIPTGTSVQVVENLGGNTVLVIKSDTYAASV
ncbi:MAG: hypothetical protein P9M15_04675 [Candidatus Electryoneaceae bacterium]|nr:hypothetical protein [Candidatus Electryoneaceae bacterium]